MGRITLLPHWVLTNVRPGFYDTDSGTTIEQTAKVYAAMRELQTDYNKFVDEVNKCITDFVDSINKDQEEFEIKITKIIHDYIKTLDLKIAHQDRLIEESIVYIKENLKESVIQVVNEMKDSGELEESILNSFNNIELRVSALESDNCYTYDEVNETLALNMKENNVNTLYVNNVTNYSIDEPNEQVNIEEVE